MFEFFWSPLPDFVADTHPVRLSAHTGQCQKSVGQNEPLILTAAQAESNDNFCHLMWYGSKRTTPRFLPKAKSACDNFCHKHNLLSDQFGHLPKPDAQALQETKLNSWQEVILSVA